MPTNQPPDRFERQADLVPQDRLTDLRCMVIGLGAVGRQVALQLAAIGIRELSLVDFDKVELTNVTTQGYRLDQLEKYKVDATGDDIQQLDDSIRLRWHHDRWRPATGIDPAVFCCVDSIDARSAIWNFTQREPPQFWCDARMLGETIRVLSAVKTEQREYYRTTLFPQSEAQAGRCTARSTIYAASIAAGLMVQQFTRWLRYIDTDTDLMLNLLSSELTVQEPAAEDLQLTEAPQ